MIKQLRARLVDLEQDVLAFEGALPGMAQKLDRIDDRVYLLETEIAKMAPPASQPETGEAGQPQDATPKEGEAASVSGDAAQEQAPADAGVKKDAAEEGGDDDNGMNILTPEAKQKIGETVGDMREIGREAAETFSSLNEAFSDITAPFKSMMKPGRRR